MVHEKTLFDAIFDCIEQPAVVYSNDARLMANRAFLDLMNVDRLDDLRQTPLGARIVPEDRAVLQKYFPVASVGDQVLTWPRIPTKEGDVHLFEAAGSRVVYGREPALLLTLRDLTMRETSDARIRELQKMEVVGQIAACLAHEVRHPLSAIRTLAELMDEHRIDTKKIGAIRDEADRAMQLVQDFLNVARPGEGQRQYIDLRAAVESVLNILRYRLTAKHIGVDAMLGKEALPVHVNKAQIQQVLFNLLINAEQAIRSHRRSGNLKISCSVDGPAVLVRIVDDGPGIPPSHLEMIFEPFFTTKDENSGLGLTVSRRIVASHGGRLWAENTSGGGATLSIELPKAREAGGRSSSTA